MNNVKVILLSGNRISLPVLRDLLFYKQLAAIVIPQQCADYVQEVQLLLQSSEVPLIIVSKKDYADKIIDAINKYEVNLGIMFSFSYKLPPAVYTFPSVGFYNIHPGPLPSFRGSDPVFQQIKNRESKAAVTIHKVDEDYDTGNIVISEKIKLAFTDTHGMLTTKLGERASRMVADLIKLASLGFNIPSRPQNNENAVYYPRQTAVNISINWNSMCSNTIVALVNACNPWNKGAVTQLNHKIIRILNAESVPVINKEILGMPGTILKINQSGLLIATAHNTLLQVNYLYTDEGFLPASRITDLGFSPGSVFNTIQNS